MPATGVWATANCELHPRQAAVAANIMEMQSGSGNMLVELRQNIAHRHAVEVTVCVPQRAVVLHAATGTGKTFVASVPALGKTTYCIVHQNSTRQWAKEAAKVGLNATWVDSAARLTACVASLASDPEQMLIRNRVFRKVALPKPDLPGDQTPLRAHPGRFSRVGPQSSPWSRRDLSPGSLPTVLFTRYYSLGSLPTVLFTS